MYLDNFICKVPGGRSEKKRSGHREKQRDEMSVPTEPACATASIKYFLQKIKQAGARASGLRMPERQDACQPSTYRKRGTAYVKLYDENTER